MKRSSTAWIIGIVAFALMMTVWFRPRPSTPVQIQEDEPRSNLMTFPDAKRVPGKQTPGAIGNGLSGFDGWYDQLPTWLETHGFPAYVLPETRSLAVSLRAMYAETNATPQAIQSGHDLVANNLIWGPQSNIFCRTLSQRFLLGTEISSRLFFELSNQVQGFHE